MTEEQERFKRWWASQDTRLSLMTGDEIIAAESWARAGWQAHSEAILHRGGSPLIVFAALVVGCANLVAFGPIGGILGAICGAVGAYLIVRIESRDRT